MSSPKQEMQAKASLSNELREKYKARSVRVRVGDTVKVVRGEFGGVEGKVTRVDAKRGRVAVEGITRERTRSGTIPVLIHTSKVLVLGLNLEDKWRKRKIEEEGV